MQTKEYFIESLKLPKLEDYNGLVYSIIGKDELISKQKLKNQMIKSLKDTNGAPTVVINENGERLNATALYMQCVVKTLREGL